MNERMATWLVAKPKGLELTSYWVTRRFIVEQMINYPNPFPYVGGLMLRATQNACNVNVVHRERVSGKSGYSLKKMIELWLNGFTSFSIKPLRLATLVGSIVAGGGFIYGIIIIAKKLIGYSVNTGYSSIMSVNLFMFGVLLCFMGLIGEYVGRIYISLNNAPQFVIKDYQESDEM